MKPTLDYRGTITTDETGASTTSQKRWTYGRLSVTSFVVTLCMFACAILITSPEGGDVAPAMGTATIGISIAGLALGIMGVRTSSDRKLAITGIVLNVVWLVGCGVLLTIAYAVFGGMDGSQFH